MKTLDQLYQHFYKPTEQTNLQNTIDQNQQVLIENLSKEHRINVLCMVDAQTMIGSLQSKESFICGFKLALELLSEFKYETDHSILVGTDVSDQFFRKEQNENN